MTDFIQEFIEAMSGAGLAPKRASDIKPTDGRFGRYALHYDRGAKKNGSYRLTVDSHGAVGQFKDHAIGELHTWSSRTETESDPAKAKEMRERIRRMKIEDEKRREIEYQEAASEAKTLWREAQAVSAHPYLKKKGISGKYARINAEGDLILPKYDFNGVIWSYQSIDAKGNKKFQYQGRTNGLFMPLTEKETPKDTIIITEGYATGQSIKDVTGITVLVAFTAGNLLDVAKGARKKFTDAKIIIAADNDAFTFKNPRSDEVKDINKDDVPGDDPRWNEWREKGYLYNTGIDKAMIAADAVKGFCIYPEFKDRDLKDKPTDFNDYHKIYNEQNLKNYILEKINPQPPEQSETVPDYITNVPDYVYEDEFTLSGDYGLPFKVLGFNDGKYYYMPFMQRQIIAMSASGHTMNNLLQLCALTEWEAQFNNAQHNKIPTLAADMLMGTAHKRGVFYESDSVRGSGLWSDAGRIIYNSGKDLFVNGEKTEWVKIKSKYVYVSSPRMPIPSEILSMNDRSKFIKIFTSLSWENPLSGILLAGWIAAAPICSTFEWRPHIWITGEAMSGKTTILEFIRKSLMGISLNFDGKSTEPKIREAMGYNVQPVVFDEAENGSGVIGNMEAILELARLSSKGGNVSKFGQKNFKAQSMFCFAGINPPISGFADETRISRLVIKRNRSPDAQEIFMEIKILVEELLTEEFSSKLVATLISEYYNIQKNFKVLFNAARNVTKDPRAAEQIGVLLSGYWLMFQGGMITEEKAKELVTKYEWNDHTAIDMETEQEQLLHYISQSVVRVQALGRDVTIGELIAAAAGQSEYLSAENAASHLKTYSIRVEGKKIFIGNSNKNLMSLLRNTPWGLGWGRQLGNLDGAEKLKAPIYFGAGDRQRATSLPLYHFVYVDKPKEVPQDLIPEYEEIAF